MLRDVLSSLNNCGCVVRFAEYRERPSYILLAVQPFRCSPSVVKAGTPTRDLAERGRSLPRHFRQEPSSGCPISSGPFSSEPAFLHQGSVRTARSAGDERSLTGAEDVAETYFVCFQYSFDLISGDWVSPDLRLSCVTTTGKRRELSRIGSSVLFLWYRALCFTNIYYLTHFTTILMIDRHKQPRRS